MPSGFPTLWSTPATTPLREVRIRKRSFDTFDPAVGANSASDTKLLFTRDPDPSFRDKADYHNDDQSTHR